MQRDNTHKTHPSNFLSKAPNRKIQITLQQRVRVGFCDKISHKAVTGKQLEFYELALLTENYLSEVYKSTSPTYASYYRQQGIFDGQISGIVIQQQPERITT